MLDFTRVSFLLSVLKNTVNILCARKVLCLACLVLLLAVANYNAEAATVGFTDVFGGSTAAPNRLKMVQLRVLACTTRGAIRLKI